MNKASLIRDFGQLFILAFDGPRLTDELAAFFKTFRIGGLILFSDNFENQDQLVALIQEIQDRCSADGTPLLISTDHEGGKIQQFRQGFSEIPPMSALGSGSPDATMRMHQSIGRELRSAGVNLNFAPVADLSSAHAEGSIGNRSFGEDPGVVSRQVSAAIAGLQQAGVLACVKHFPGHGATLKSSHQELPVIDLDWASLAQRDLRPFQAAIETGVSSVMTAHIVFPNAGDAVWPASLSPFWLNQTLRNQFGFEGVIITDSLEMKAITNNYSAIECGIQALRAGNDILLYYREKSQFQTFYELRLALEQGAFDLAQIERSLERVRALKSKIAD